MQELKEGQCVSEVQDKPSEGLGEPGAVAPAHRLSEGGRLCRERAVKVDAPGSFLDSKIKMTC